MKQMTMNCDLYRVNNTSGLRVLDPVDEDEAAASQHVQQETRSQCQASAQLGHDVSAGHQTGQKEEDGVRSIIINIRNGCT